MAETRADRVLDNCEDCGEGTDEEDEVQLPELSVPWKILEYELTKQKNIAENKLLLAKIQAKFDLANVVKGGKCEEEPVDSVTHVDVAQRCVFNLYDVKHSADKATARLASPPLLAPSHRQLPTALRFHPEKSRESSATLPASLLIVSYHFVNFIVTYHE